MPPLAIMGAVAAASAAARGLQQRGANRRATKEYNQTQEKINIGEQRYGDYQRMLAQVLGLPFPGGSPSGVPGVGGGTPGGLGASLGSSGIFGPQTTTGTSSQFTNMLTRPEVSPEYQQLESLLKGEIEGSLKRRQALPPGFRESLARGVVQEAEPAEQRLRNLAAQRGVSANTLLVGSPVEAQRAAGLADINVQTPLLERKLRGEDVDRASQFAQSRLGQRQRGSVTGTTSETGPANIGALLAALGMLAPRDPTIVQRPQMSNPFLSGIQSGAQTFGSLYGAGGMSGGRPGGSAGKFGR